MFIVAFILFGLSMVSAALMVSYAVQTVANLKPGVDLMTGVQWNPFNHMLISSHLSDA